MKNDKKQSNLKPYELFPLKLLESEEDKYGNSIFEARKLSNSCLNQQFAIVSKAFWPKLEQFTASDMGVINEVYSIWKAISKRKPQLVPDFESLPRNVLNKLKNGTYHLGDSRQVIGNARAVIVDEAGIRIRDLTFKTLEATINPTETIRNLALQMELKQLQDTIDEMKELQNYQLELDRNRDMKTPFLNARTYILQAQNAKSTEERIFNIKTAMNLLITTINSTRNHIETTVNSLDNRRPTKIIKGDRTDGKLRDYLQVDIIFLGKITAIHLFLSNYLGEYENSLDILNSYLYVLRTLTTRKIGKEQLTAIEFIHDLAVYDENNLDYWYKFQNETKELLELHDSKALEIEKI